MADQVNVQITASVKGLIDGLADATSGVKKATQEMTGMFSGLGKIVENLKAPFVAFAAIMAGGKLFGDAIKAASTWNNEVLKLTKAVGGTTEQASVLKVALHGLGIDTDTYARASMYLTRQVAQGSEGLRKLGVDIRDSNGHMRPMTDIMQQAVDRLNELKPGVDRNAAGIAVFGKQWMESQGILKLTSERMAEAKKEAEDLHLIVGPEGVKQTREYQEGQRKLSLVMESLKIQVGNAVLPILLQLGKWMGESGPQLAQALEYSIKGIIQVFWTLKMVVEVVCTAITALLTEVWDILKMLGKALYQVFKGDFEGAMQTMKSGWQEMKADGNAAIGNWTESLDTFAKKSQETWATKPATANTKTSVEGAGAGGKSFDPTNDNDRLAKWKAQLEGLKGLEENWFTWNTSRELAFWQEKLAHCQQGTKLYGEVLGTVNKLRKEQQKEELALQQTDLKAREQAATRELDLKANMLARQKSLGEITEQQELEGLKQIEAQKLEVKKAAIEAEMEMAGITAQKKAELRAQEAEAVAQFNQKVYQLNTQLQQKQQEQVSHFMEPFVKGFQSGIQRMMQGTLTFSQAVRGIFGMLRQAMMQTISQMVSDWIAGLAKKLAAWIAMKVQELIFHQTTETAKATSTVASATTQATANAVAAGSAGAASAASNGPYGWIIAIPVGLAILAGVMAMMGSIKSSAGGFDIPRGLNPMAQLHEEETVIPAPIARAYREGAKRLGGDDDGGGQRRLGVNVSVHGAIDGNHVLRTLTSNEGQAALVKAITRAQRNGRLRDA